MRTVKKMLLTKDQRSHLLARIDAKRSELLEPLRYGRESKKPTEIVAAEKLIRNWESRENKANDAARKIIEVRVRLAKQAVLFSAPEQALEAVQLFEAQP